MATTLLNGTAYEIGADNLILAAEYPVVTRELTITNPQVALKRGMAIINHSGTLYVAGEKSGSPAATITGEIIGVLVADADANTDDANVDAYAYVSGAFNKAAIVTTNSLDVTTTAYVLGAQGNGIYLL